MAKPKGPIDNPRWPKHDRTDEEVEEYRRQQGIPKPEPKKEDE